MPQPSGKAIAINSVTPAAGSGNKEFTISFANQTTPGTYTIMIAAYSSNGTALTNATSTDANCSGATCIAIQNLQHDPIISPCHPLSSRPCRIWSASRSRRATGRWRKPRRELARDISIIAIVQLCALGYGTVSLWNGRPAGNDPWDAWTLEWATTSPPPSYNFEEIPTVHSRRPLWDLKHPDDPDWQYE